jgi:hypothetical protein
MPYQIVQVTFVKNWVLTCYTHTYTNISSVGVELRDKILYQHAVSFMCL